MTAVILHELKQTRRSLIASSVGMFLLVIIGAAEYQTVVGYGEAVMPVLDMMPRIMRVMFGMDAIPVDSDIGYYVTMYLWYCFLAFAHAAFLGATIIAREERDGTGEFIFSKPCPRSTVITAKTLAAVVNTAAITVTAWLATLVTLVPQMQAETIGAEIAMTMIGMWGGQLLFLALGLMLSALFRDHSKAVKWAVGVVLISYGIAVVAEFFQLRVLDYLSPFRYFNGPMLIERGFDPLYLLMALLLVAVAVRLTYTRWQRRDLHA